MPVTVRPPNTREIPASVNKEKKPTIWLDAGLRFRIRSIRPSACSLVCRACSRACSAIFCKESGFFLLQNKELWNVYDTKIDGERNKIVDDDRW